MRDERPVIFFGIFIVLSISFVSCSFAFDQVKENIGEFITVTREGVYGCTNKDNHQSCNIKLRWGRSFYIEEKQKKSLKNNWDWVEVKPAYSGTSTWWIKRSDVALSSEFRPYTKTLPVKSIRYDTGHMVQLIEFEEHGKTYVYSEFDANNMPYEPRYAGKREANLYYFADLMEVRVKSLAPPHNEEVFDAFGFKDGKVYPLMCVTGELCEVVYRDQEKK